MSKSVKVIPQRRRRESKTNYHKRLNLLKSRKLRLVIRKTSKDIIAQIVEYKPAGDIVLVQANGKSLNKLGWNFETKNIPSAYLIGLLIGKKAQEKKLEEVIIDSGNQKIMSKSRLFATVKGAIDAGLKIPCDKDVLPGDDRISGKHIADFAKIVKENRETYKSQFSKYQKENIDVENMPKAFEEIKKKIEG